MPVLCNKSQGYFIKITKNGLQNIPDTLNDEGEGDMMQALMAKQMWENLLLYNPEGMQFLNPGDDPHGRRHKHDRNK